MNRKPIFDAVRQLRDGRGFTLAEVKILDAGIDRAIAEPFVPEDLLVEMNTIATKRAAEAGREAAARARPTLLPPVGHLSLTPRVALEIIGHEAIVQEAYKDSKGIWTWGIGVTDASGHKIGRYKDNPQTIARCLEVYLWLLRAKYIPDVIKAFDGFDLTEAQFAAAVSFHYNTGAILRAGWVKKVKAGDMAGGRKGIMEWRKPPEIVKRRGAERDLFFDGKWSQDGKATVYGVRKPSYSPDWKSARRVDVTAELERAMR